MKLVAMNKAIMEKVILFSTLETAVKHYRHDKKKEYIE